MDKKDVWFVLKGITGSVVIVISLLWFFDTQMGLKDKNINKHSPEWFLDINAEYRAQVLKLDGYKDIALDPKSKMFRDVQHIRDLCRDLAIKYNADQMDLEPLDINSCG